MKNFFSSRISLFVVSFLIACLTMQAQAEPIPLYVEGRATNWNLSCSDNKMCTNEDGLFSAGLSDRSPLYDMRFWEENAHSTNLSIKNVRFSIANMSSNADITGLNLSIIDKNPKSEFDNDIHPGTAHFHDTNLIAVIDEGLPDESRFVVTTDDYSNSNYFKIINISDMNLRPGQTIEIYATPYNSWSQNLTIHQYPDGTNDRDFDIWIKAQTRPEATIPLPSTLLLLLAGFVALTARRILAYAPRLRH